MKTRWMLAAGMILLLGSTLPASAQMMGGGSGMMEMGSGMMEMMSAGMPGAGAMGGCPGMVGQPTAFGSEGPWISFALAHAREIDLTPDQAKALAALRDDFRKEAIRLAGEIRAAELDVQQLYSRKPVDLQAVETKIRAISGLEADLRLGRVKALEKASALLTAEQQEKLGGITRTMGRMHGAFMMGGPREFTR